MLRVVVLALVLVHVLVHVLVLVVLLVVVPGLVLFVHVISLVSGRRMGQTHRSLLWNGLGMTAFGEWALCHSVHEVCTV